MDFASKVKDETLEGSYSTAIIDSVLIRVRVDSVTVTELEVKWYT